ncbi:MAG: aspartyl/glutamyl-tRNA amidotransferase subunit C [Lachnospiraceae bacterium]|nr:aspartyl/glutamyl-tRNA amidotransferase subunit C [Lachnospiraceae bacterium]
MDNNYNRISKEMLDYVGILSKLEFEESEKESYIKGMEEMLDYVDILNELDTDTVPVDGGVYVRSQTDITAEKSEYQNVQNKDLLGNVVSAGDVNTGSQTDITAGKSEYQNVFREDTVSNENGQEAALYNAPVKKGEYIVVPKTI